MHAQMAECAHRCDDAGRHALAAAEGGVAQVAREATQAREEAEKGWRAAEATMKAQLRATLQAHVDELTEMLYALKGDAAAAQQRQGGVDALTAAQQRAEERVQAAEEQISALQAGFETYVRSGTAQIMDAQEERAIELRQELARSLAEAEETFTARQRRSDTETVAALQEVGVQSALKSEAVRESLLQRCAVMDARAGGAAEGAAVHEQQLRELERCLHQLDARTVLVEKEVETELRKHREEAAVLRGQAQRAQLRAEEGATAAQRGVMDAVARPLQEVQAAMRGLTERQAGHQQQWQIIEARLRGHFTDYLANELTMVRDSIASARAIADEARSAIPRSTVSRLAIDAKAGVEAAEAVRAEVAQLRAEQGALHGAPHRLTEVERRLTEAERNADEHAGALARISSDPRAAGALSGDVARCADRVDAVEHRQAAMSSVHDMVIRVGEETREDIDELERRIADAERCAADAAAATGGGAGDAREELRALRKQLAESAADVAEIKGWQRGKEQEAALLERQGSDLRQCRKDISDLRDDFADLRANAPRAAVSPPRHHVAS